MGFKANKIFCCHNNTPVTANSIICTDGGMDVAANNYIGSVMDKTILGK